MQHDRQTLFQDHRKIMDMVNNPKTATETKSRLLTQANKIAEMLKQTAPADMPAPPVRQPAATVKMQQANRPAQVVKNPLQATFIRAKMEVTENTVTIEWGEGQGIETLNRSRCFDAFRTRLFDITDSVYFQNYRDELKNQNATPESILAAGLEVESKITVMRAITYYEALTALYSRPVFWADTGFHQKIAYAFDFVSKRAQ